jgi:hypothetical protein
LKLRASLARAIAKSDALGQRTGTFQRMRTYRDCHG